MIWGKTTFCYETKKWRWSFYLPEPLIFSHWSEEVLAIMQNETFKFRKFWNWVSGSISSRYGSSMYAEVWDCPIISLLQKTLCLTCFFLESHLCSMTVIQFISSSKFLSGYQIHLYLLSTNALPVNTFPPIDLSKQCLGWVLLVTQQDDLAWNTTKLE
jgi:hypothetical protein